MTLSSFDRWIEELRTDIAHQAPELLTTFDVYAGEAIFGRHWLEDELQKLPSGAPLLEVGAGMFLLACQLKREGFAVTALEPVGDGFGHFHQLQNMVLAHAARHQAVPEILPQTAETLTLIDCFALAYSINVMEHVADVQTVIVRVLASLKANGHYRFVCPNYSFPFEAHFKIPIIINKNITLKIFKQSVIHAADVGDAQGLWNSLNWITVTKIRRYSRALDIAATFNRGILNVYLDRALNEKGFCVRHPVIHRLISIMQGLGLLRILQYIPIAWMPVIDCVISRKENA